MDLMVISGPVRLKYFLVASRRNVPMSTYLTFRKRRVRRPFARGLVPPTISARPLPFKSRSVRNFSRVTELRELDKSLPGYRPEPKSHNESEVTAHKLYKAYAIASGFGHSTGRINYAPRLPGLYELRTLSFEFTVRYQKKRVPSQT